MNLYDEEELRKKNEKNKKIKNLILVSIIFTVVLIALLIGVIYYLISNPNKITVLVNGNEDEQIENIIITKKTNEGNTIIYYPIRELASKFKFNSYDGDYSVNVENSTNCYIESEDEVAIFTQDSNILYKVDKTEADGELEYKEIRIDNPIIKENDALYVDTEGLAKAFNFQVETNSKKKNIKITTLEKFIESAEKIVTANDLGTLDSRLANQKATLDNMIVIKAKNNGKKGVINFSTKEEILGFQYDDITYIPEKKSFMILKDNKVGIIGSDKFLKIKPQYDKLVLIDSQNGLYLAQSNRYYGVIDENGDVKIPFYYSKVGVDIRNFEDNGLKTGYILLGRIIPVKKVDGKWIMYRIDTSKNPDNSVAIQCTRIENGDFDDIGCITNTVSPTISSLIVIKDYDIIVVKKNNQYGFMDLQGKNVLGLIYNEAYLETTSEQTNYYATYGNGSQIEITEELKKLGYKKND